MSDPIGHRAATAAALLAVLFAAAGCPDFEPGAKLRSAPTLDYLVHAQDQHACSTHLEMGVELREPASLEIALTQHGDPSRPGDVTAVPLGSFTAGEHTLRLPLPVDVPLHSRLGYRLTVRRANGKPQELTGKLEARFQRADQVPVANIYLNDVFLWDGHFRIIAEDLKLPDYISLVATREYSSSAADRGGVLGPGWIPDFEAVLRKMSCGDVLLVYGSTSHWYRPLGDGRWLTPPGFHHTLLTAPDGSLVFMSKDGTEYDFAPLEPDAWYMIRVLAAGAQADLRIRYERVGDGLHPVEARYGSLAVTYRYDVVDAAAGRQARLREIATSDGAHVAYTFDPQGHLAGVSHDPASNAPGKQAYRYQDTDGFALLTSIEDGTKPQGAAPKFHKRVLSWQAGSMEIRAGGKRIELPLKEVARLRDDSDVENEYAYSVVDSPDGPRSVTTVTRAGKRAQYARMLADTGITEEYTSEKGTTRTRWNRSERWADEIVDYDGTRYRYEHDAYGNLTLIETAKTVSRYTFYPPEVFDPPYISLRMRERIEENVHKLYYYDVHGRLVRTDPPS